MFPDRESETLRSNPRRAAPDSHRAASGTSSSDASCGVERNATSAPLFAIASTENGLHGASPQPRKLRKQFREAAHVGVSRRADRMSVFRFGDAAEEAGPARILRSPLLRRRRPVTGRSSEQFLHALLNRSARAAGRSNHQNGIVAGERAGNFFPALGVHRGRQRLRAARRSFQHEHVLRWANIEQKFLERPRQAEAAEPLLPPPQPKAAGNLPRSSPASARADRAKASPASRACRRCTSWRRSSSWLATARAASSFKICPCRYRFCTPMEPYA